MAILAGITINVFDVTVAGEVHKIISKDGLHGMICMAYVMGIHHAIVVRLVVKIERVSRVVCLVSGFGRVRQDIANTFLGFEMAGLMRNWSCVQLSLDVLPLSRGCYDRGRFSTQTSNQTFCITTIVKLGISGHNLESRGNGYFNWDMRYVA
jgi:hypothetical protein